MNEDQKVEVPSTEKKESSNNLLDHPASTGMTAGEVFIAEARIVPVDEE